jgi:uncharacterized membrane protein
MARRSYFGDIVLVLFLLTQVVDGTLTYLGIHAFGRDIEANPIVSWYIAVCGAGVALIAVKTLAAAGALILHLKARHRTVGALTVMYLGLAVWPWVALFSGLDM